MSAATPLKNVRFFDPQFNSRLATMMVSRLMQHGKKSTAQRILSDAFGLINERTGGDPSNCSRRVKTPRWSKSVPAASVARLTRFRWKYVRNVAPPWPCAGW